MAGFTFGIVGLAQMALFFKLMGQHTSWSDAWVGSAVEYGPYQEFGTDRFPERPHWRNAIPFVVQMVEGRPGLQAELLQEMLAPDGGNFPSANIESGGEAPLAIAKMIEREVKLEITALGIIDTGNYRGSITTGATEASTYAASAARATKGIG